MVTIDGKHTGINSTWPGGVRPFQIRASKVWRGVHPAVPSATAATRKRPRMPQQEARTRAPDSRRNLPRNHKRPSSDEGVFQGWVAYGVRFISACDLCGARGTIGWPASQLTQIGTVANLSITENVASAHVYDSKIRTYARALSKFRQRKKDIIGIRANDGQRIRRESRRDCGSSHSFSRDAKNPKGDKEKHPKGNKWKGEGKHDKGRKRQTRRLDGHQLGEKRKRIDHIRSGRKGRRQGEIGRTIEREDIRRSQKEIDTNAVTHTFRIR